MSCREVSNQVVAIMHLDVIATEQFEEFLVTDFVAVDHDTHTIILDDINVLLTDELVSSSEAITVLEGLVKIIYTEQLVVFSSMAAFGSMDFSLEMLNDDWVIGADFKTLILDTLAEEELDGLLVANLYVRINIDALSAFPEVIKVTLTEPLLSCLGMQLMLSFQQNALVMFDMSIELVVADHGTAKETVLMTSLLLFVGHKFVSELFLRCFMMILEKMLSRMELFMVTTATVFMTMLPGDSMVVKRW